MTVRCPVAVALSLVAAATLAAVPDAQGGPVGLQAQVVAFAPDSIGERTYPTLDYANPKTGPRQATTTWRVVTGTGNAAELWLAITGGGRLLDLGGRYVNYTDDRGLTWSSVRPLEPLANAEGAIVAAPNGDVVGVTWDPYSGDRVITYKYEAAEDRWYYTYDLLHTPFWDRPGIQVVPGPLETPDGTVPYISFINGFPHDPWYYSTDGLNYTNVSSLSLDRARTQPITQWLDVEPDPALDWIQPNVYFPLAALGAGRALDPYGSFFSPDDLRWHTFSLPGGGGVGGIVQIDGLGRLHRVIDRYREFDYAISADGGRSWESITIEGAAPGDFRANAAAGVAAVWGLDEEQDLVFKIDISTDEPRLLRRYAVGLGDDCRCGRYTYSAQGGHRFDFSSIGIFPDGRVAVSFIDSTTTMPFPTLGQRVVAPALAVELDTTLS